MTYFQIPFCATWSDTVYKTCFREKNKKKRSPHSHSSVFIAPLSALSQSALALLHSACRGLTESAVQLSEAVVGGGVPRRLAQQTVSGVLYQFCVPGKSRELGVQGEAVAVEADGACSVRETREERGPLGSDWPSEGDEAGGAPCGSMKTRVPTVRRFLHLQRWKEWEVCQRGQRRQGPGSVRPRGGEGSVGWGGRGLAVQRQGKGVESGVLAREGGEWVQGWRRGEGQETLHTAGRRRRASCGRKTQSGIQSLMAKTGWGRKIMRVVSTLPWSCMVNGFKSKVSGPLQGYDSSKPSKTPLHTHTQSSENVIPGPRYWF